MENKLILSFAPSPSAAKSNFTQNRHHLTNAELQQEKPPDTDNKVAVHIVEALVLQSESTKRHQVMVSLWAPDKTDGLTEGMLNISCSDYY